VESSCRARRRAPYPLFHGGGEGCLAACPGVRPAEGRRLPPAVWRHLRRRRGQIRGRGGRGWVDVVDAGQIQCVSWRRCAVHGAGLGGGAQTYSARRPRQQGKQRALAGVVVHPREVLGESVRRPSRCWCGGLAGSSRGGGSAPTSKRGRRRHRRQGVDGVAW
jgi:hypothetical protein